MAFSALLLFHGTPSCLRNVKSLSRYLTNLARSASAASDRKVCVLKWLEELGYLWLVFFQVPTLEAVLVDGFDNLHAEDRRRGL